MKISVFSRAVGSASTIGKKIQQINHSACPQRPAWEHSRQKAIALTIYAVTYRMGLGSRRGRFSLSVTFSGLQLSGGICGICIARNN